MAVSPRAGQTTGDEHRCLNCTYYTLQYGNQGYTTHSFLYLKEEGMLTNDLGFWGLHLLSTTTFSFVSRDTIRALTNPTATFLLTRRATGDKAAIVRPPHPPTPTASDLTARSCWNKGNRCIMGHKGCVWWAWRRRLVVCGFTTSSGRGRARVSSGLAEPPPLVSGFGPGIHLLLTCY